MDIIYGSMEGNMKAFGKTIKCTVREHLYGLMVENMKDSM